MCTVPAPVSPTQPKTFPDVEATGQLACGSDRIHDLIHGHAVLTVTKGQQATLYWVQAVTDGGKIVALDLTKFGGGEKYRVALEDDAFVCDCPDATYRCRRCKHVAALHDALTHPAA
jgi:hypothetical protein